MRTLLLCSNKVEKTIAFLKEIMRELKQVKDVVGVDHVYATLNYIIEVFDISEEEFAGIIKENLTFIEEEKIMTIAKQWEQRGLKKGMEQGIEQGLEQGKAEALKNVTIKLFKQGLNAEQIVAITGLSSSEVEVLKEEAKH